MYQDWLTKHGFTQVKAKLPQEKVIYDPNKIMNCKTCGTIMNPRAGTSQAGKPYKGYFCSNPNSKQLGCKPIWAN
jgi:hypothetical protein